MTKPPVHRRFARCVAKFTFCAAWASSALAGKTDQLVLSVKPHGIGYSEAKSLQAGAADRLLAVLDDQSLRKFWVNAIVALGFQEDPKSVAPLIAFWKGTTEPSDLETRRAHLAVPFALGSIAAKASNTDASAFLTDQLTQLLDRQNRTSAARADLEQEEIEQILIALAVSGQPGNLKTLRSLTDTSRGPWGTVPPSRQTIDVLHQSFRIADEIQKLGRADYFSYRPEYVKFGDSPSGAPAPHQIDAKRHVEADYTNSDLDTDLNAGSLKLFTVDSLCAATGGDLSCPVSFQRLGSVSTFGSAGDGLNTIASSSELNSVFAIPGRVKVVAVLSYCSGFNPSVIGCAPIGGNTMVIEQGWVGSALLLHEFGHNRGLNHRDDCINNVMSSSTCLECPDSVVSAVECAAFGGNASPPPPPTPIPISPAASSVIFGPRPDRLFRTGFEEPN